MIGVHKTIFLCKYLSYTVQFCYYINAMSESEFFKNVQEPKWLIVHLKHIQRWLNETHFCKSYGVTKLPSRRFPPTHFHFWGRTSLRIQCTDLIQVGVNCHGEDGWVLAQSKESAVGDCVSAATLQGKSLHARLHFGKTQPCQHWRCSELHGTPACPSCQLRARCFLVPAIEKFLMGDYAARDLVWFHVSFMLIYIPEYKLGCSALKTASGR